MKHAPKDYGYDSSIKMLYRRKLWGWIDDQLDHRVPIRRRTVAYLDTRQALETRFLLTRGYSPQNLHAINCPPDRPKSGPAEMALLTMELDRLGLPRVNTHGVDFVRTIAESGVGHWDVMAFDGCGPVASRNTLRCIKAMCKMASAGTVVVANVLCGRDTGETARTLAQDRAEGNSTHERRYDWLKRAFTAGRDAEGRIIAEWSAASVKKGHYVSTSGQPMLWLAVRLGLPPFGRDHFHLIRRPIQNRGRPTYFPGRKATQKMRDAIRDRCEAEEEFRAKTSYLAANLTEVMIGSHVEFLGNSSWDWYDSLKRSEIQSSGRRVDR